MPKFKRILLKIGGESLQGNREYGIDPQACLDIAHKIKAIHDLGVQIAVVVGGGNIFRGVAGSKNGMDRATADYVGMLATVMNGISLMDALTQVGTPVRVQSALDMTEVAEMYIRNTALRHLEKGRVVIITAGTGNPYVTTDTGAALHGLELHCDVMIKATKVDGVYDKDPMKHKDAKRYQTLNYRDAIISEGVEVMDITALTMAQENNLPLMVFKIFDENNLVKAVEGEDIGTYVANDVETEFA